MIRQLQTVLLACACAASLAACGRAPQGAPLPAAAMAAGADAMAAGALSSRVTKLWNAVFDLYDTDDNGKWTPDEFELPEDRFLNLFHKEDADDDRIVTKKEFFTTEQRDDMVLYVQARAGVTAQTVGGRVSFDKAFDVLDVYLAPYLNKDDRKKFIKKAFGQADGDDTDYLKTPELEGAYAILLAKAEEKRIEKAANRSRGQGDLPISADPPAWVKKHKKAKAKE